MSNKHHNDGEQDAADNKPASPPYSWFDDVKDLVNPFNSTTATERAEANEQYFEGRDNADKQKP